MLGIRPHNPLFHLVLVLTKRTLQRHEFISQRIRLRLDIGLNQTDIPHPFYFSRNHHLCRLRLDPEPSSTLSFSHFCLAINTCSWGIAIAASCSLASLRAFSSPAVLFLLKMSLCESESRVQLPMVNRVRNIV